jgi:glutamine amidotransferase-like uncharacterized protein
VNSISSKEENNKDTFRNIRVAILAEEPFFWGSRKYHHKMILDNYSWTIKDISYRISICYIYDKDIVNGKLNKSNFEVLIIPGGGVGNNQALLKGFNLLRSVRKFKQNIANFVKQGGGYIGICGGAALITDLVKDQGEKPVSFVERQYNKSSLDISCVSSYFKNIAFPLFYLFQYNHPEKIGNSAYAFSFAPGETVDGKYIFTTGCPIDINILKDNPIFSDYPKKTRRIRWWAGQALIIPEKVDREIFVLGKYPNLNLSYDKSTRIYAWRYIGGIRGILKSIFKSLIMIKKNKLKLNKIPLFTFYLAGDWEITKKIIKLDNADKPCITAEIYPNKNRGRILLSTVHVEKMIWWGGHIEQVSIDDFNCIGKGFHCWKNIDKLSSDLYEEITYNWWILRRFVAWAAKIPDEHLPPKEKSKIDIKIKEQLEKKIFWNGSLLNQMEEI